MRALFILLSFVFQSFLTPLLSPWPPPDLLLVAALWPLGRTPLWRLLLLAYGLGGVQDLVGGGGLGLHALGLAAAVFVAGLGVPERLELGRAGLGWQLSAVALAFMGKGAAWTLLLALLGQPAPLNETLRVVPLEALLTLGAVALLRPLSTRFARRSERRLYL